MSQPIHQEITLPASPERVFEAYMDSKQHSAFTDNAPADISRDAGGIFSCHGGAISGRNVELVPNTRIVQAWRVANWPAGMYSIVRLDLEPAGKDAKGTKVTLHHDGFPDDARDDLAAGWNARYWKPLEKFLA